MAEKNDVSDMELTSVLKAWMDEVGWNLQGGVLKCLQCVCKADPTPTCKSL